MVRCIGVFTFLAFAALAGTIPASATVQFTSNIYTSVSGDLDTNSIANGDFNNDGILDMVTINTNTLSFYAGIGSGSFASPVSQTIPENLGQGFAADVNGDGKLDLVIGGGGQVGQNSVVTILLGNGDGTFTPGATVNVNGRAQFITMADFNGDHVPDFAASVCTSSRCNTQVFLGQGNGTFKRSAALIDGGGVIVAVELNADGHQDIAVLGGNGVVVYLGNGDGSFQSALQK